MTTATKEARAVKPGRCTVCGTALAARKRICQPCRMKRMADRRNSRQAERMPLFQAIGLNHTWTSDECEREVAMREGYWMACDVETAWKARWMRQLVKSRLPRQQYLLLATKCRKRGCTGYLARPGYACDYWWTAWRGIRESETGENCNGTSPEQERLNTLWRHYLGWRRGGVAGS